MTQKEKMKTQITFRLSEEDFKTFQARARHEQRSFASLSKYLVIMGLAKDKGGSA